MNAINTTISKASNESKSDEVPALKQRSSGHPDARNALIVRASAHSPQRTLTLPSRHGSGQCRFVVRTAPHNTADRAVATCR